MKNLTFGKSIVSQKPDGILEKDQCLDEIEDISDYQTLLWGAETTERLRLAASKWHFI